MEGPQTITKTKTRTKTIIGWALVGGAIVAAAAMGTVSRQKVKKAVSDAGGTGGVSTIANQKPDLKIQLVSLLAEPPYNVGDLMVFKARVVNIGTSNTAATTTSFSLDIGNNGVWEYTSASGVNPNSNGSTIALAPNAYAWATLSWTGASTIPPGSFHYRIRACADGSNSITEFDENNNCRDYVFWTGASPSIPYALPDPDLIIASAGFTSSLSATNNTDTTATPFAGNQITFSSTSENAFISAGLNSNVISMVEANTPASQRKFRLDIGNDNTWDIDTLITGSNYGWTAAVGTHKFEFCADATSAVTEFREDNNCTSSTLTVAAQPPAQFAPDLVVTSLGFDADNPNLTVGGTSSFAAVVSNQGTVGTATTFTTRLRLDLNNDGSWDVTPPTKTTNILNGAGTSGSVATEVWQNFWTSTAGTHKAEACADVDSAVAAGVIAEGNESNNCTEFVFTINSAPAPNLPDLIVESISMNPENPTISGSLLPLINFTSIIRNQGSTVSGNFTTFHRVDTNNDGSFDKLISSDSSNPQPIAVPPANGTVTLVYKLGNYSAGTHRVKICADNSPYTLGSGSVVLESDENNNCAEKIFIIVPPPEIDLTIPSSSLTMSPSFSMSGYPFYTTRGSSLTFSGTVTNLGLATAPASLTRLSIREDGAPNFTPLSPDASTGALAPNATETETWSNAWTANTFGGQHRFKICADSSPQGNQNPLIEINEGNNCAEQTFGVFGPDLTIQDPNYHISVHMPGGMVAGQSVTFKALAWDQAPSGAAPLAAGETRTRFRLDINNNGVWDIEAPLVYTPAISAGQTALVEWPQAWISTAGTHTIEVCLDINDVIAEYSFIASSQSESNNCHKKTFTIYP